MAKSSKSPKSPKSPKPTWYERDYERKSGEKLSKYGRNLKDYTINPSSTQIPKSSRLSNRSIPSIGGILSILLVIFIVFVVHLKILDKPYIGVAYWLEVFSECPITIDISLLYNVIPSIQLPEYLGFLEFFVNFLIDTTNIFVGSLGVLGNLVQMIVWFVGKIFVVISV